MKITRISLRGIIFIFAISFYLPCDLFACWTPSDYDVDCCFINPSEMGDYCCATVADCCDINSTNCERNTWRDSASCPCGDSCNNPLPPTTSCPTTSSSTSSTSSSTTTSSGVCRPCNGNCCIPGQKCCEGGHCCDSGLNCCGPDCCDTEDLCVFGTCITIGCPFTIFYGKDSEEVELLRKYRDEVLSKSLVGQEIIKLYYLWSPAIVKAMEEDEEFQEYVKEFVDELLPMIEEVVE